MPLAISLRRPPGLWVLVVALSVLTPACSATDPAPLPMNARVVFLHHSTGSVIWNGGVPGWFDAYNATNGTAYAITELAFPNTPYPWDNYPYDYWNIWVSHAGATAYQEQPTLELLTTQYHVIVFKHCFPVSSLLPDTGEPDIASSEKTAENYKLQYAALKSKMRAFPANRFVVWTGAALLAANTTPEQATRARAFFDWVRTVWDEPGDNIYVWDFFGLETDGGLYLTPEHGTGDSHPNATFAAEVAPLFGRRVVDVILGKGDLIDTTQVPGPDAGLSLALAGANPVRGTVRLRLGLARAGQVELSLHDSAGRRVALLAGGESPAGTREVAWDSHAAGVPAGVYFARLKAGGRELTQRIVILD